MTAMPLDVGGNFKCTSSVLACEISRIHQPHQINLKIKFIQNSEFPILHAHDIIAIDIIIIMLYYFP